MRKRRGVPGGRLTTAEPTIGLYLQAFMLLARLHVEVGHSGTARLGSSFAFRKFLRRACSVSVIRGPTTFDTIYRGVACCRAM